MTLAALFYRCPFYLVFGFLPYGIEKGNAVQVDVSVHRSLFYRKIFFDEWCKEIEKFMPKKYTVIVKVKNNTDGTAHCLKYRVSDLKKFTKFLDEKWTGWKWFNVYSNTGINKGKQLANFTKNKRPELRFV